MENSVGQKAKARSENTNEVKQNLAVVGSLSCPPEGAATCNTRNKRARCKNINDKN